MIEGFGRFVGELRAEGIRVSPAEWIDALRAVSALGVEDRERVRRALRATLVKRRGQRERFDRAFDRFFAAPRFRRRRKGRDGEPAGLGAAGARGSGGAPTRDERPERRDGKRPSTGSEAEPARERASRNALAQLHEGQRARIGRLAQAMLAPRRAPDGTARQAIERRPLRSRLDTASERALAREVRRTIERLRLGRGRRARNARRGRPYLRRLFRDSLRTGGVPFTIPHRRRRPRHPRVTLLIDVSWSVERAAGLFLQIAGRFLEGARDTRVLLFVDRPVDATREVDRWWRSRATTPFPALLRSIHELNLHAPSDYGRLFDRLSRSSLRPGGPRDLLLILGDGRTNRYEPLGWALREIASDCRAAIWLVPEPFARWGEDDSALPDYLPWVDTVVETADLRGLGRGVAELLRRLR